MLDFEQAIELVTPEIIADDVPCGPDPEPVIEKVLEARAAGVDHLYFHQIGPDQEGFVAFWRKKCETPSRPERGPGHEPNRESLRP